MSANPFEPAPAANGQPAARPRARSHGWVWFFAVVALLTVAAIVILGVVKYRFRLEPLTRERLEAARELWRKHGPQDYNLRYTTVKPGSTESFEVRVRAGEVVYAAPDKRPLAQKANYYGMPALFRYLDEFLREDARPGRPRAESLAAFDPHDGHLVRYVRRVADPGQKLEISVDEFEPVSPGTAGR
jgi:hypothetical protein